MYRLHTSILAPAVRGFLAAALSGVLSGCAQLPHDTPTTGSNAPAIEAPFIPPLTTLYDSVLIDSQTRQPLRIEQLARQLHASDVIFIGEFHGNHASHLLQAQLQAQLYRQKPQQILSMEQFERPQQPILNRYLDDEIGEVYLIDKAPAWQNYAASYRPLVEFAKRHFLPVVAANAPGDLVRCIGREGERYLDKLNAEERHQIAEQPFAAIPGYDEIYQAWSEEMGHADDPRNRNRYLAQLVRDNTMAESILQAIQTHPGHQVIHLNGAFHSNRGLGTVAALKRLAPQLKIHVISPLQVEDSDAPAFSEADLELGDTLYLLQPQPVQYRDAAYRAEKRRAQFTQASQHPCR